MRPGTFSNEGWTAPDECVPDAALGRDQVRSIMDGYSWYSGVGRTDWCTDEGLTLVHLYLKRWQAEYPYWTIICAGGVRGYSLYLHELAEVNAFLSSGLCPFDAHDQRTGYAAAHSAALALEHRFLQLVAKSLGYDFSLVELVTQNPHGDPPDDEWAGDWILVQDHQSECLATLDHRHSDLGNASPHRRDQLAEFYDRIGFEDPWGSSA